MWNISSTAKWCISAGHTERGKKAGDGRGFAPHPTRMQRILDLQSRKEQNGPFVVGSRSCCKEQNQDATHPESQRKAMEENKLSPMAFSGFLGPEAFKYFVTQRDRRRLFAYPNNAISPIKCPRRLPPWRMQDGAQLPTSPRLNPPGLPAPAGFRGRRNTWAPDRSGTW